MRLALANVLALIAYVGVIWTCFAFILDFATTPFSPWGFKARLDHETFGFAAIFMVLYGPFELMGMLVYFIAFRARLLAIVALAVTAIVLSIAFMTPLLHLPGWPGGSHGQVDVRGWIMFVWAGVTATLAHHIIFALIRPPRESPRALDSSN